MADQTTQLNGLSTTTTQNNNTTLRAGVTPGSASGAQARLNKYQQGISSVDNLYFPEDIPKYHFFLEYANYSRRGDLNRVNFVREGTIRLPLPMGGLVDNHEISFSEEELGALGAGLQGAYGLNTGKGWVEGAMRGMFGALGPIQTITGANLQGIAQVLTGLTPNRFLTILLKGPRYKRHEFSWKLAPRSRSESNRIKNIIQTINNKIAVDRTGPGNLLWSFPSIWKIGFIPNHNMLFKFKPCVIESAVFNYTPSGTPSFYSANNNENAPEAVEIKLRFIELEFWLTNQFFDTGTATEQTSLTSEEISKNHNESGP